MAKPMQNRTQSGQGYRTPVMQRPPYPGAPQPVRPGAVMPPVSALTREERLEAKRLAEEASFSSDGSVFDIMTGEKDAAEAFAGKEHEKPNRKTDKEDD